MAPWRMARLLVLVELVMTRCILKSCLGWRCKYLAMMATVTSGCFGCSPLVWSRTTGGVFPIVKEEDEKAA